MSVEFTPTIIHEAMLSLADAAKMLPPCRQGRPVSVACILRWILQGSRKASAAFAWRLSGLGAGGSRVKRLSAASLPT